MVDRARVGVPVWLVGFDSPSQQRCARALADALGQRGGQPDVFSEETSARWLSTLNDPEAAAICPRLIILDEALALRDDAHILKSVSTVAPWALIPRVVIAASLDHDRRECAYANGASSWVLLPAAEEESAHVGEVFADYWLRTTLLPPTVPTLRT